jgi:branched-chain amino acid transport system permease protein
MTEQLLWLIITGIMTGSIYGLLAMGLTLQYGVCQVLNISHGEYLMLGAMLTLTVSRAFGISPLLAVAIIGPLMFVIGFLLQITLFRTLKARTPSPPVFEGSALLVCFGLYYIISFVGQRSWSALTYTNLYLMKNVSFLGVSFGLNYIIACVIALADGGKYQHDPGFQFRAGCLAGWHWWHNDKLEDPG